jgi:plasmid stabilization system protein ParE
MVAREPAEGTRDLFLDEIADTFALIESVPSLGRPWTATVVPGVRRVVMRATRYHVYYREDEEGVVVLAVWSSVRGRGPDL